MTKQHFIHLLEENDLPGVVKAVRQQKQKLNLLIRISYDKTTLAGWRAIKAMGLIARELLVDDIAYLRETCRKLLWSLSDESGGIGWSAPELLGEIVSAAPERFADIVPLIESVYDAEEETFRPGVLYALMRISEASPKNAVPFVKTILLGVRNPDPLARVYALEAACNVAHDLIGPALDALKEFLPALQKDTAEALLYEGNDFTRREVSQSASKLSRLVGVPI